MKSLTFRRTAAAIGLLVTALVVAGFAGESLVERQATERRFRFEYSFTIAEIPVDAKSIRIWAPVPSSDANQTIESFAVETTPPIDHRITRESMYGNKALYLEASEEDGALPARIDVTLQYDVTRGEIRSMPSTGVKTDRAELLAGDSLAPLTDEVRRRAAEAAGDAQNAEQAAREIYDRVLSDMTYDKSGRGWGRGDLFHACEVGAGNCSDFHTLFIAMSRARSIPAFFEIGFPIPPDRTSGEIGGYHCWAWFESDANTWRPVDASEADKYPEKIDYFFGAIDQHRVALSRGRDLELRPAPAGGPVNFFIYPVVEIDGEDVSHRVEKTFRFRDLNQE